MNPFFLPIYIIVAISFVLPFVRKIPYVLYLAIVNVAIYFYLFIIVRMGVNPLELFLIPEDLPSLALFTHLFLHGSLLHILGNLIFLLFFGLPLERRIGPRKIAIIYLGSGIIAALADSAASIWITHDANVPSIGASGAIFGIMGAYLVLYPDDVIPMPLIVVIMDAPVWFGVLLYGGLESYLVLIHQSDGIGHMAHVGGLAGGILIAPLLRVQTKKPHRVHKEDLSVLVHDARGREILKRIADEDIPEVRDMWIEELIKQAKCPRCGANVRRRGDYVVCTSCHWSLRFAYPDRR